MKMKTLFVVAVLMGAIGSLGATLLISQDAALVSGALTTLKFETLPGKPDVIGAPPKMRVTKKTLEYLGQLLKDGKTIEVGNDGSVKVVGAAK
jgi:hypothetical protein